MHKCYIIMGVTGSGKTTVGRKLASSLGLPFLDADDFHPESNILKMRSGQPLNDADRKPWLEILAGELAAHEDGAVLGCSALKKEYRRILEDGPQQVLWIYLDASRDLIRERLSQRMGHFMPASLIDSQFEALEIPEDAIRIDAGLAVEEIVGKVVGDR